MFTPVRHASLHSLITGPLLHAIFSGKLPGGTHLVEQDLAAQFQVSRAPVREALREIAAMGLAEIRPNRGTVVLPFNPESLQEIYHVRTALECEAARLASKHLPSTEASEFEKKLRDLLQDDDRNSDWCSRAQALDEQFHALVATWAGENRLSIEIRRYSELARLIEEEVSHSRGIDAPGKETTIRQHLAILSAMRHGDAEKASLAMREHLGVAADLATSLLFPKR